MDQGRRAWGHGIWCVALEPRSWYNVRRATHGADGHWEVTHEGLTGLWRGTHEGLMSTREWSMRADGPWHGAIRAYKCP